MIDDYELLQKEHSKMLCDREEISNNLKKISQKVFSILFSILFYLFLFIITIFIA